MDRRSLVRTRLHEVKAELRDISEAGPRCLSCECRTWTGHCGNVAMLSNLYSHSSGKLVQDANVTTEQARAPDGLCGPEGLLWEPLPWYRAPFAQLADLADRRPWLTLGSVIGLWGLADLLF